MCEKNVLAVLGSPHADGTIAAMLDLAVREAERAGHVVTKIDLYEKELFFCTGCRASTPSSQKIEFCSVCSVPVLGKILTAMRWHRLEILTTQWCGSGRAGLYFLAGWSTSLDTHICVQKDDIQEISALLQKCQLVILAAPVYWANVPAPVKNLFDRLLGMAMEGTDTFPKPRLRGKRYVILTSCNTPAPFSWLSGQSRGAVRSMERSFKTAGMRPTGRVVCANARNKKGLPERTIKKIGRCLQ